MKNTPQIVPMATSRMKSRKTLPEGVVWWTSRTIRHNTLRRMATAGFDDDAAVAVGRLSLLLRV